MGVLTTVDDAGVCDKADRMLEPMSAKVPVLAKRLNAMTTPMLMKRTMSFELWGLETVPARTHLDFPVELGTVLPRLSLDFPVELGTVPLRLHLDSPVELGTVLSRLLSDPSWRRRWRPM